MGFVASAPKRWSDEEKHSRIRMVRRSLQQAGTETEIERIADNDNNVVNLLQGLLSGGRHTLAENCINERHTLRGTYRWHMPTK
jgi:hypothetical protein